MAGCMRRGRFRGGDDEDALPVGLHRRVVGMHARHRGDTERGRGAAGGRACQAVAARAEGRSGHHHVGPQGRELGADRGDGRLLPLGDVVVAADDGADDAPRVAERGLERAARTHRLGPHRDADVGALLATDPGKELVQVVGDTQGLAHGLLLAATARGRG